MTDQHDGLLQYAEIMNRLQFYGKLNLDTAVVETTPCSEHKALSGVLKKLKPKPNACYSNIGSLIFSALEGEKRYVLGYGQSVIPVDHAILQLDGLYYDPTWDLLEKDPNTRITRYFLPLFTLMQSDLLDHLDYQMYQLKHKDVYYPDTCAWMNMLYGPRRRKPLSTETEIRSC